jgi:transposase
MLHIRNSDFPLYEPLRRFEAYPRPQKRRTFTPEEKARLVAESFASSESVCAFARRHGLMPSQLFAWRKRARGNTGAGHAKPQPDGPSPSRTEPSVPIEISIGAVTVRVPEGADPATLKLVLQALREAA